MKKLLYTVALALFALCFGNPAFADNNRHDDHARGSKLEGTWWLAVERPGGLPPFVSLHTYTAEGGMVGTNTSGTAGPTHGNWVKTGRGKYTVTFWAFRFDAARQHTGYNLVSINLRLVGPDHYRSVHFVQIFDLNWGLVDTRYDNGAGTRLPVLHFPQQP